MKRTMPLILVLSLFGCGSSTEKIKSLNANACVDSGGIDAVVYPKNSIHQLILCNDGSVKWNKNKEQK